VNNQDYMIRQVRGWLKESPVDEIKKFLDIPKEDLVIYHSTVGRSIRNAFELWAVPWTPVIDESGVDISEEHPDAVSMRVLEGVWEMVREELGYENTSGH